MTPAHILTPEEVALQRAWTNSRAAQVLADSHEALRDKLTEAERERDEARDALIIADTTAANLHSVIRERDAQLAEARERLALETGERRMCVNCGRTKLSSEPRWEPLPECTSPDGFAACTFDLTPHEAWQHWQKEAHELRETLAKVEAERDKYHGMYLTIERFRSEDAASHLDEQAFQLRLRKQAEQRAEQAEARLARAREVVEMAVKLADTSTTGSAPYNIAILGDKARAALADAPAPTADTPIPIEDGLATLAEVYSHKPWCHSRRLEPLGQFSPNRCNCDAPAPTGGER